jgi:VWFA-related protein
MAAVLSAAAGQAVVPPPAVGAGRMHAVAGARAWRQQIPRIEERVVVSRLLVDARVLDAHGGALAGLTAADFRATLDGRPARVESATWIGASADGTRPLDATELPWAPPEPPGRLIVFLFQKDLEPSRIVGLMRMLIQTQDLLGSFGPDDRVAVLSFDSHLKIWLDFTADRDAIRRVLADGILFQAPPAVEPGPYPSLARYLTPERARRAYEMEDALALVGEALVRLPGAKSVIVVGHGFGRLNGGRLDFDERYGQARRDLQRARASVFCLDTTEADSHTLEAGLMMVADDTGGFFERTHLFPAAALTRLSGALAGHYVLFLEVPDVLAPRAHRVEITLANRPGRVLAWHRFMK